MDSIRQPMETPTGQPKDSAARRAGLFLLLTAAATVVMVYARVSADADQPTLLESLRAIAASKAMYSLSGAARFISGVTLIAGAWFLLRTRVILGGIWDSHCSVPVRSIGSIHGRIWRLRAGSGRIRAGCT